jgi:hypothetical protein
LATATVKLGHGKQDSAQGGVSGGIAVSLKGRPLALDLLWFAGLVIACSAIPWYLYTPGQISGWADHVIGLDDPLLVSFIYERMSTNLLDPTVPVFEGGIFHPHADSMAFCENLIVSSLIYRSLRQLVAEPLVANHLTTCVLYALNFLAMWWFARAFVRRGPAIIGGLVFAFAMARIYQTYHAQLIPHFFTPIAALFVYRYECTRRAGYLYASLLALAGQLYCGIYLGVMLAILCGHYFLLRWWLRGWDWHFARHFAMAAVLASAFVAPLVITYQRVADANGMVRPLALAKMFSAHVLSLLSAPAGSLYYPITRPLIIWEQAHEKYLFLGIVPVVLCWIAWRQTRRQREPETRYWRSLVGSQGLLTLWLMLGPWAALYSIYYYVVPGLEGMRVPARFILPLLLFVGIGSAIGAQRLLDRIEIPWRRFVLLAGLALLLLIENRVRLEWVPVPRQLDGVTAFLAETPDRDPVAHFPLLASYLPFEGAEPLWRFREVARMVASSRHDHPILNGWSGFVPQTVRDFAALEQSDDFESSLIPALVSRGFGYLVIDKNIGDPWLRERFLGLVDEAVYEDAHVLVARIR